MTGKKSIGKANASITIFLTLIFGVILAMVTAMFENVRVLSGDAYLRAAVEGAMVSVFGDYNRELYQSYGLFGYGGYDGLGVTALSKAIQTDINHNIQAVPKEATMESKWKEATQVYTSLYRICDVEVELPEALDITDPSIFYEQVEKFLKSKLVHDVTSEIQKVYQKIGKVDPEGSIPKNLDLTSQYEQGKFEIPDMEKEGPEQESNSLGPGSNSPGQGDIPTNLEASSKADRAGGNPLETFRELLRDGVLHLVCDTKKLSEESISTVYSGRKGKNGQRSDETRELGTADLLKNLISDKEGVFDAFPVISKEQGTLISYAQHVFPNYITDGGQHYQYGLEYLISGSEQEQDNLMGVVQRLLVLRTALNYAYVQTDVGLQSDSLATATEIAGALGLPMLITAIQQTILLILSVEESCVDIAALLKGKTVPVWKDASCFKMTYPEICSVSRNVFHTKAEKIPEHQKTSVLRAFSYQDYLWLFLMMTPEKTMRLRMYDLIQDDLQMRCNATFSLEQCVNKIQYQIRYRIPFLFGISLRQGQKHGTAARMIKGFHCYH